MSHDGALTAFCAIAAGMGALWLWGTVYALSRAARRRGARGDLADDGDVVTGELVARGEPDAVSRKLCDLLVSATQPSGAGAVRVAERTPERIVFDKVPGGARAPGLPFDAGVVTLEGRGDRLRLRYAVSMARSLRMMRLATYLVCFAYGGLFVAGTPLLIWFVVLGSDDPAVRWQVFQTAQMVHGVWPPFLVGFIAGRLRRATSGFFDALLANASSLAGP